MYLQTHLKVEETSSRVIHQTIEIVSMNVISSINTRKTLIKDRISEKYYNAALISCLFCYLQPQDAGYTKGNLIMDLWNIFHRNLKFISYPGVVKHKSHFCHDVSKSHKFLRYKDFIHIDPYQLPE